MIGEKKMKNKLYVFILKSLTPSQQAVQGGHAVSILASKNPQIDWTKQTFVYLKASKVQLNKLRLLREGNSSYFIEPDFGNILTSFACFGDEDEFSNYRLI